MAKIFITGGAGYIGSHVVKLLGETIPDADILVYDNLKGGHASSVLYGKLVKGDLLDYNFLKQTILDYKPDIALHFAALIAVGESVVEPAMYYENNIVGSLNLLKALKEANVKKFIFSSTAAVYGDPETVPIKETARLKPTNPYGWSKLIIEQMVKDFSVAYGLEYVIFRYFNVAGADPENVIGDMHKKTTHLIPIVLDAVLGLRDKISIFGTDYNTPDGTAIRDYIHVMDLANLHFMAIDYLLQGGKSDIFNCGYGKGFSVKEVVETVKKVTKKDFKVELADRRPGDSAILVADPTKVKKVLQWEPQYNDLSTIIEHAYNWHKKYKAKINV